MSFKNILIPAIIFLISSTSIKAQEIWGFDNYLFGKSYYNLNLKDGWLSYTGSGSYVFEIKKENPSLTIKINPHNKKIISIMTMLKLKNSSLSECTRIKSKVKREFIEVTYNIREYLNDIYQGKDDRWIIISCMPDLDGYKLTISTIDKTQEDLLETLENS